MSPVEEIYLLLLLLLLLLLSKMVLLLLLVSSSGKIFSVLPTRLGLESTWRLAVAMFVMPIHPGGWGWHGYPMAQFWTRWNRWTFRTGNIIFSDRCLLCGIVSPGIRMIRTKCMTSEDCVRRRRGLFGTVGWFSLENIWWSNVLCLHLNTYYYYKWCLHTSKNTLIQVLSPGIYSFCRYFQRQLIFARFKFRQPIGYLGY